jgi:hypothetical protein
LSRNKDRLGARQKKDTSAPQQLTQNENNSGGFSFVVPTEFVELPSGGRFYPAGHPLHNQETIEIKHMTAKEEDLLTSRALLKKGIVLDRLMESVITNKAIRPNDMLVGDRNAVVIAARISGYGADYETQVTCPACQATQQNTFDLSGIDVYDGSDLLPEEAVDNKDGTFTTTLPRTKLEITFRLLSGHDEKNLLSQTENARKAKKEENNVTRQLKQFIVAVNGDTSQEAVNYVVYNIPSMDARHLRHVYRLAAPNVNMTQNFECDSCGYEQVMEVPLTADFFWPDR